MPLVSRVGRIVSRTLGYGAIGSFFALLALGIAHLENRPDLAVWHEAELDAEFTAESTADDLSDYLETERQVFRQLEQRVYRRVPSHAPGLLNRYHRGSLADPSRWPRDWNRTFELSRASPKAGILLLHGLSDSPYSLRSLGQRLHEAGGWVLGLRLPGHGTAPSGLTEVHWEDMAAAVRIALRHLKNAVGDRPIYIIGYSTGGALAVQYALERLSHAHLPAVAGLVLISPAIGVTPLAAFAVWQARLGHLLKLDKLEWSDIRPEYDPFKYNSFAVNAGDQVYRLTVEISRLIAHHGPSGGLDGMPPILAFQSAVDATVSTRALIDGLFGKLPSPEHELVLFDINRLAEMEPILMEDPKGQFLPLLRRDDLPFTLSVATNDHSRNTGLVLHRKVPGTAGYVTDTTDLSWPSGIYSLSHVALPFDEDDPLYGPHGRTTSPAIHLGDLALRGERSVLQIPAADMLRLRWNPFYSLIEQRIEAFTGLASRDLRQSP